MTNASAGEPTTHKGKNAQQWHARYVKAHKAHSKLGALIREERAIKRKSWRRDTDYAIRLASSTFGVSYSDMWSVARCESHGYPLARNSSSSASGVFQFLDSTWANQGIAGFSVFDPVANSLGAARIVARQGWRQWSCQPG